MAQYIAFLRAINVGGHVVKMDKLRDLLTNLGLSRVETFIASGNVLFESRSANTKALEKKIAAHLEAALGYPVATFVRSFAEVAAIGAHQPFDKANLKTAHTVSVGFLTEPLTASAVEGVMALKSETDDFHVHGREVYWLTRVSQAISKMNNTVFEKRVKVQTTFRSTTTVGKLAALVCSKPGTSSK